MCVYIAVCNSINIGYTALKVRFAFTDEEAGLFFTMPYIISALLSLPVGLFIDRYDHHRMTLTLIGSSVLVLSHCI